MESTESFHQNILAVDSIDQSKIPNNFGKPNENSFSKDQSFSKENTRDHSKSFSKVDQSLYQDALRRIENKKSRKFVHNLSLDLKENRSQILKEKSQENTQIKIQQKLTKEVHKVLEALKINANCKMSYLQCSEILNEMGFLKYHNLKASFKTSAYFFEERTLLAKMWDMLHFQNHNPEEGVELQAFLAFLAGVIGISFNYQKLPDFSDLILTNADESGCLTFNRIEETQNKSENFQLDFKRIHKEFDIFYRNRLGFLKNYTENNTKPEINSIKLSKKSKNLAVKHYQKILDQNESFEKVPYYDRLTRKQAITQAKIIQKSVENTQKILENCSFKPAVIIRPSSQPKVLKQYQKETKHRIAKNTEEIEFEKQKKECTFKPNLAKNFKRNDITDEKLKRQQEKSIERIEKARIERNLVKNFKERGVPIKNNVLQDIGNLSVSQINPELLKKYFGLNEKNERKNTLQSTISSTNKISPIQQPKYSPMKQRMKSKFFFFLICFEMINSAEEGFYTRVIQKEYDTLKEKFKSLATTDSDKAPSILNLKPILFLEINLGEGRFEKISVYENTNPHDLAEEFAKKHSNLANLIFICFII